MPAPVITNEKNAYGTETTIPVSFAAILKIRMKIGKLKAGKVLLKRKKSGNHNCLSRTKGFDRKFFRLLNGGRVVDSNMVRLYWQYGW